MLLLLLSARAVQATACANHSLQSCFSQKEFCGELIVFRHLSMDYRTFLNVINLVMLKDLRISLSFKIKT